MKSQLLTKLRIEYLDKFLIKWICKGDKDKPFFNDGLHGGYALIIGKKLYTLAGNDVKHIFFRGEIAHYPINNVIIAKQIVISSEKMYELFWQRYDVAQKAKQILVDAEKQYGYNEFTNHLPVRQDTHTDEEFNTILSEYYKTLGEKWRGYHAKEEESKKLIDEFDLYIHNLFKNR